MTEILGPDIPIDKGIANLYNALSSLRNILEPGKYSKASVIHLEKEYCGLDWIEQERKILSQELGFKPASETKRLFEIILNQP